jgi:hypothetical protein
VRADDVIRAFVAALEGDAALITALGGENIFRAGANRAPQIPSVEWRRITNGIAENTEPMLFQFDVWAKAAGGANGYANAMAIEARLRAVLLPRGGSGSIVLNGLRMLAEMDDSRDHEDPEQGVVHTSLDIRYEPAKQVV